MHIGLVAGGVAFTTLSSWLIDRSRRSTGRDVPRQGDTTAAGPLAGGRRRVEGSHGRQGGGLSVLDGVQWLNAKVHAKVHAQVATRPCKLASMTNSRSA